MSCDFAPDCSATAVRDPLVEIAKPWKNPAATFDAPMPIISWLGWSSSPRRAANADAVAMVSVSDTSTMPIAARSNGPTSSNDVHGIDGVGKPCGSVPTVATPCAARSNAADTMVAPATATSTAGIFGMKRGSTSSTTSTPRPTASAAPCVSSRWSNHARSSSRKPSASVEKPHSFGSCPTMIVIARPFMYPTCTSLERRSATKPSLPRPSPISMRPTSSASIPASAIALPGSFATMSGAMAAKISGETDESGPSTSTREGPKIA